MDTVVSRSALAGLVGGLGWVAFPFGTLGRPDNDVSVTSLVTDGLTMTVAAALIVIGLRVRHRGAFGRLGVVGTVLAALAVALMGGGFGVELVSLAIVGDTNSVGHAATLIGFLLLLPGSVLLGIAVARAGVLRSARALGTAVALTVPLARDRAGGAGRRPRHRRRRVRLRVLARPDRTCRHSVDPARPRAAMHR